MLTTHEPLIIGHRGASACAPENTLLAFERAMSDGADGVEFDVQLARDGVPVVIHDATLKRTGSQRYAVCDLSSIELGKVDVGSWFNIRFPARARIEYATATVPLLADVIDLLKESAALLYIEMKCATQESQRLAQEVSKLISRAKLQERSVVVSFALNAIQEIKQIDGAIRTGALFEPKLTRPFPSKRAIVNRAMKCQANETLWHRSMASARAIEETLKVGLTPVVWTADHRSWIRRARSLGIHAVITNEPRRMATERDRSNVA